MNQNVYLDVFRAVRGSKSFRLIVDVIKHEDSGSKISLVEYYVCIFSIKVCGILVGELLALVLQVSINVPHAKEGCVRVGWNSLASIGRLSLNCLSVSENGFFMRKD